MLKMLLALMFLHNVASAACVYTDASSTSSRVRIAERSGVQRAIVPTPRLAGYSRCQVTFQAKIGSEWYMASGWHDWPSDKPSAEACAIAQQRADDSARVQAGPSTVATERTMVCTDREDFNLMRNVAVGTQAQAHQFRPHPDFPREFWHNGARCRWFVEPAWSGKDIRTYQGIICQLNKTDWVVVDKF